MDVFQMLTPFLNPTRAKEALPCVPEGGKRPGALRISSLNLYLPSMKSSDGTAGLFDVSMLSRQRTLLLTLFLSASSSFFLRDSYNYLGAIFFSVEPRALENKKFKSQLVLPNKTQAIDLSRAVSP